MLKALIQLFIKQNGRNPNAVELLKLKFKAANQSGKGKVFDLTGNQIDTSKPIIGGKNVANDVDGIINNLKSMEPMDAMKEANLIIGRKGQYKNLSIDESQKILKDTDDHIFSRDIQYDEFGDPIKRDPDDFASGGMARVGMAIGGFTKLEVLIQILKNTIKGSKDSYVTKTFPKWIKELQKNPKLALNKDVWKELTGGLPKNQKLVVHSDDSVDFFTQSKFGPHNIEKTLEFQKKHNLSRDQANKILRMDPEDRVLEMKKLETIGNKKLENQMDYPLSPEEIKGKKLADSMSDAEIELRGEFPGITDEMINNILTDKNPQRIAEVKQTMREALEMGEKGMSPDEIIKTFKDTSRTKQASGGIAGQLHLNQGGRAKFQDGTPAVDPRMLQSYEQNKAENEAQRVINQLGRQNISNKGDQQALSLASPVATFFASATPYKNLSALRTEAMDKSLFDIIEKKRTPEGVIGYSDYDSSQTAGSEFPALDQMLKNLAAGQMSAADFANATTLGRLTYKIDPDTGKVSFGSNKYDFRPDVADQGGLFGYLAKKANERGININPNVTMPTTQQSDLQRYIAGINAANQVDATTGNRLYDYDKMFDDYRYNTGNYSTMGTTDSAAITAGTSRPYFYAGDDTPDMVSNFQSHFDKPYGYALAKGGLANILGV